MSYTLTVIHPPTGGAAFGKAVTLDPVPSLAAIKRRVFHVLDTEGVDTLTASDTAAQVITTRILGVETTHTSTGLAFRIDPADTTPHPCPCCGRLVKLDDHAYADAEDAYCTGCFTWNRGDVQCLPANTAHPQEES